MDSEPPQPSPEAVFEQTQRMSRMVLLLIACLEIPTIAMMVGFYAAGMIPGPAFAVATGIPVVLAWLIWWSRIRVRLLPDRLRWSFRPFWVSSVEYAKIGGVTVVEVDPMRDFGGWGVRLGKGTFGAIAKKGGAVRIQRVGKKRDLILGSDDAEALANAILDRALAAEVVEPVTAQGALAEVERV